MTEAAPRRTLPGMFSADLRFLFRCDLRLFFSAAV